MKKTQEVIGLPIISISDGMEVGKVKNIIINADKGAIDYIVVDSGIQILGARVIPTEYILGIGEYALTIENDSAINDISKIPAAIDLLQKNILVKGTKVLTKKGRLIGEIGDIYVNEDDACSIMGLEYIADITQKRIRFIPRESVITFGKNLVIVKDDVENNLLDNPAQLSSGVNDTRDEKKNIADIDIKTALSALNEASGVQTEDTGLLKDFEVYSSESTPISGDNEESPAEDKMEEATLSREDSLEAVEIPGEAQEDSPVEGATFPGSTTAAAFNEVIQPDQTVNTAANLFEQRQRQYLDGRKATKTITGSDGAIIVSEGSVITGEIIDAAKKSGKMIELVMNNKA